MLERFPGRRALAALTAVALLGCASWRRIDLTQSSTGSHQLPFRVRVTRVDSTRVTVLAPFLRADTLYGRVARDTIGIPVSDIDHADRERSYFILTAAMVMVAPIAILATLWYVGCGLDGHRCRAYAS